MPPSAQVLRIWLRHRRYGVPPEMIEAATGRRLAGDWRGACTAAHLTPEVDLRAVERDHGRSVAAAVEDDLLHLAPDLLRWHEPLHSHFPWPGASGAVPLIRLTGGQGIVLLQGPRSGPRRPFQLRVGDRFSPAAPLIDRRLWDVRHAPGLRALCGPEPVSTEAVCPHTTGRQREAAAAAGIDAAGLAEPTSELSLASHPLVWSRLVPAARALLDRHGSRASMVDLGEGWLDLRGHPTVIATPAVPDRPPGVPLLQISHWQEPLDAELLRHGLIDPDALHPLVHDALLPDRSQARRGYVSPVPTVVRIGCGGGVHRLAARDRRWHPLDHDPSDLTRETALAALGGPVEGCAGMLLSWRTGTGLLPPSVQDLHDELWQRVGYGDTDGVLRLLDDGFPPAADRGGLTLMHALARLDHERALLHLLTLGLDVNARTPSGDTPLHTAAGLSIAVAADLVEALLRAGADPRAVNDRGQRPADVARTPAATALLRP